MEIICLDHPNDFVLIQCVQKLVKQTCIQVITPLCVYVPVEKSKGFMITKEAKYIFVNRSYIYLCTEINKYR